MKMRIFVLSALMPFMAVSAYCGSTVRVASGPAPMREIIQKIRKPFETKTGIHITAFGESGMPGPNVLVALDEGRVDVGVVGGGWGILVATAKKKGHRFKHLKELRHVKITSEPTIFITYPGGPKRLSRKDLKRILTGEVMNWKALGGKDLPIQIAAPFKFQATRQMMIKKIMDGKDFRPGVKYFDTFKEISDFVAKTPGAIGYGSVDLIVPGVNHPEQYALDRPVWFITRGAPKPSSLKLLHSIQMFLRRKAR